MTVRLGGLAIAAMLVAAPAWAQGAPTTPPPATAPATVDVGSVRTTDSDLTDRAYLIGSGGFAASPLSAGTATLSSAAGFAQGDVRIAKHLLVFCEFGRIGNLAGAEQGLVNATAATLSATDGLNVIGTARIPAMYSTVGFKFQPSAWGQVAPYLLAGMGYGWMTPSAQFAYTSGPVPGLNAGLMTPSPGFDVSGLLIAAGAFTSPSSSSAYMEALGAGADLAVNAHWVAELEYRYSRFSASTPLHAQGLTFGAGWRFR